MRNNSVTAILLVMAGIAWGGAFGGGSGTQKDPWQIGSALELNEIGADPQLWDRHFILMADLDLSELDGCDGRPGFNTIGIYVDEYSRDNHPFTGSFNGNGHIITGLTIHDADKNYVGLFNAVDGDAYLKDICLTEVDIQSETAQGTGGLAGIFLRGWIMNCTVKGGVVTVRQGHAGGLVGQLLNFNKLFRCCSEITVISEQGYAGGLVGLVNRGSLQECYARGRVLGNSVAGGLAGQGRWLFVKDSYSQCDISGIICGGLVGQTIEVGNVLENTYAAGLLSGENVGGLIGSCEYTMVCDSYWDQDICGTILSDGGGVPKSQSAMRNVNTFYGWGCDAKWRLNNGAEYPALAWQNAMGSIIRKPEQPYGGGSGESYDPYLICTPAQLNAIGLYETDWNKCFKLMADLDLAGMEFNVIGHLNRAYNGCFDGNGYTIYNLTIKAARRSCCGLLGNVTNNLMISNLTLDHPRIENGDKQVGALIGKLSAGGPTIRNCHAIHAFVAGQDYCGGLIGNVIDGVAVTLERCSVTGRIQGNNFVGGVTGHFANGTISQCSSSGTVISTGRFAGGLAGQIGYPAQVVDCYSRTAVSAVSCAGGLIGYCWDLHYPVELNRCYAAEAVAGEIEMGGLVGKMHRPATVHDCYWDIDSTGQETSAAGTGVENQLMHQSQNYQGWDFSSSEANIWTIYEGKGLPRFRWQVIKGDLVWPEGIDKNDLGQIVASWLYHQGLYEQNKSASDYSNPDLDDSQVIDLNDFKCLSEVWGR